MALSNDHGRETGWGKSGKNRLESLRDLQRFADHTWRTANLWSNRSVVLKGLEEMR